MIQVSVTSTEVRNQRGTARVSGKQYDINFQTVWFHTHDKQGNKTPTRKNPKLFLKRTPTARPFLAHR